MDEFKFACEPAVGGWRCPCCGPRSAEDKKAWRRRARARLKEQDRQSVLITPCYRNTQTEEGGRGEQSTITDDQ